MHGNDKLTMTGWNFYQIMSLKILYIHPRVKIATLKEERMLQGRTIATLTYMLCMNIGLVMGVDVRAEVELRG